jgi:hypothetical protein
LIDLEAVAQAVVQHLGALAGSYGRDVTQQVADEAGDAAVDATMSIGRKLLRRLLKSRRAAQVEQSLTDLGEQPDSAAAADVFLAQVRMALEAEPALTEQIAEILERASGERGKYHVRIESGQGVQVGDHNTQHNTFN